MEGNKRSTLLAVGVMVLGLSMAIRARRASAVSRLPLQQQQGGGNRYCIPGVTWLNTSLGPYVHSAEGSLKSARLDMGWGRCGGVANATLSDGQTVLFEGFG
eukprot:Hpha_TRINITY_DN7329_c0_g1::TRINITY_DN7329_c0_g1_i1::g.10063::m.10063